MKKVFSIVALTLLMAGNLNASEVYITCEDRAWNGAENLYNATGDSILAGQFLEYALSQC